MKKARLSVGLLLAVMLVVGLTSGLACSGGDEASSTPTPSPTTTPTVTAKEGDKVMVNYIGTYDDGEVFDSSIDPSFGHAEPLQFVIGEGTLLAGFEQAVIGLHVNESTTVHIPADEAYGGGKDLNFKITLIEIL